MRYTPDLNADFIYRGTYTYTGERGNLREARKYTSGMTYGNYVYAIDISPNCYAPVIRCFVYDVANESDALEALYQAAVDMGPPKDDNRINLFSELYQDCDGEGCWCHEHYGEEPLEFNGKLYHKAEEGPIGIVKVTERKHLHDAGQSKIRIPLPRTYRGVHLRAADGAARRNGFRWEAYINGGFHYAETLAGIKQMVRDGGSKYAR